MITAPSVNRLGDALILDFHQEGVHVTLDRWRELRGDTFAEIAIRISAPVPTDLHQSRVNLSSMSHREQLARMLRKRSDAVDWPDVIEQVARMAIADRRRGEPIVNLADLPFDERPAWQIDGWIPRVGVTVLYGDGGTGKSTLAMALACCVEAGGLPFVGISAERCHVLYDDGETDATVQARTLRHVARGLEIDPPPVAYLRSTVPLIERAADLRFRCAAEGIGFYILDSVGYAGAAMNEAEPVIAVYRALQSLRIPVLAIHHVAKNADGTTPYGSVYHRNSARSAIEIRREQGEGGEFYVGLFHTKLNEGLPQRPLGLKITRTDQAITITRADILRETETLGARFSLPARIENCLLGGALAPEEIALALDAKEQTVERVLRRMRDRKQTARLADGRWGLRTSGHLSADSPDNGHGHTPPIRGVSVRRPSIRDGD